MDNIAQMRLMYAHSQFSFATTIHICTSLQTRDGERKPQIQGSAIEANKQKRKQPDKLGAGGT